MKNQELDDLLRRKLGVSSKVPESIWDKIDQQLTEQEAIKAAAKPLWLKYKKSVIAAAAAIAIIISTGAAYYWQSGFVVSNHTYPALANNYQPAPTDNTAAVSSTENKDENSSKDTGLIQNNHKTHSIAIYSKPKNDQEPIMQIAKDAEISFGSTIAYIEPIPTTLKWEKINTNYQPMLKEATPISLPSFQKIENAIASTSYHIGMKDRMVPDEWSMESYYPNHKAISKKSAQHTNNDILLGIAGGYNYGSLNNGGAVALNTRKQISSKVFVDGSLGMVMNNSSNKQSNFKGDIISFKKNVAQKISTNNMENLYTNTNPFYFVQINPTVGVNLTKNIDVSFGPDYQQMVSNLNHDVVNLDDNSKLLPRYDFGVTGKAEINLGKNLKAGVVLREGLTSIIRNNSSISDRRYLQFQLKFQLPYKND